MKKLFSLVLLGLIVSVFSVGTAHAIIVDGSAGTNEWDAAFFNAGDPSGDVGDANYDISRMMLWWDSTHIYIRTDVYGTPTLASLNLNHTYPSAYYMWDIDTDQDYAIDYYVKLEKISGPTTTLEVFDTSDVSLGTGTVSMGSIVEARFAKSIVSSYGDPTSICMVLDNQGSLSDDLTPDIGWADPVPEPASMALLGLGLLGLGGGALRRKKKKGFTA